MVMLGVCVLIIFIMQVLCMIGLFWGMVELKAMQKSTHSVQFVPAENEFQKMTNELKENLTKDIFDNIN